jgi:hypothetical protein
MSYEQERESENFSIPNVDIEQTLKFSNDGFSAINIRDNLDEFENTQESLNTLNQDKRIPLGLFFFKEDNIVDNNFPINFGNSIFNQITNVNLISNGDCKRIEKFWLSEGFKTNVIKPSGGWEFIDLQGVRYRTLTANGTGGRRWNKNASEQPLDDSNRIEASNKFIQDPTSGADLQGQNGYGGFIPYTIIKDENQEIYWNDLQKEFVFLKYATGVSGLSTLNGNQQSYEGFPIPLDGTKSVNGLLPDIAAWIQTQDAFSNKKCLVFDSRFPWSSLVVDEFFDYSWKESTGVERFSYDVAINQDLTTSFIEEKYRTLNQTQTIYNSSENFLSPYSSLKIKFKMKTMVGGTDGSMPSVEVGIYDNKDYLNQRGSFNSTSYPKASNFNGKLNSVFGGRMIAVNKEMYTWEDFEFTFNLGSLNNLSDGDLDRALNFFVQSHLNINPDDGNYVPFEDVDTGDHMGYRFIGRVLLDNFEVYESYEFYPDCDVRKKISNNNYGKADLTKYYDPSIDSQKEAYKDSTAPLEAQFYFYPTYPTNEIFDVERTPMYNDFQKGLFYIYDINWGDGSAKEFTTEPEQIDEETMLYHTYEESGIFEVTGFMLRLKADEEGNPIGLVYNKKFKLVINVNESLDEDFEYFGNNGFSFIPYKNTLPIIGGYSKESIYYKSIKRTLGFLQDGTQTNVKFKNIDSKIKLEKALLKMDESFIDKVPSLSPYFENYNSLIEEGGTLDENESEYIRPRESFYITDLNIVSNKLDILPGQIVADLYGQSDISEPHWKVYLTAEQAQAFEHITQTQGISYGAIPDISNGMVGNFNRLTLLDTNIMIDIEYGAGYGEYIRPNGTWDLQNIYKSFDGTDYKILLVYNTSGNPLNSGVTVTINDDDISTPYMFFGQFGNVNNGQFGIDEEIDDILEYGYNFDVYNNGSNIPGIDIENLSDESQLLYLELLPQLPWPFYIQEFEFTENLFESDEPGSVEDLNFSIFLWKDVGRWDIAWYLEAMMELISEETFNITNDKIIDRAYRKHPIPSEDGATYLSRARGQDGPFPPQNAYIFTEDVFSEVYNGLNPLAGELGESIGDCDLTNIKYYNKPKSIWEMFGFEENDLQEVGNPEERKYWKNIIPEDYSIFNREGINLNANIQEGELTIDTYSDQDWLNTDYYYPVLPKYNQNREFIEGDFPINKIPFPTQGIITDENETSENLLINITSEKIDNNVINDKSGTQNLGFSISDYKPNFNNETLKPLKRRTFNRMKTSKTNGAF